METNWKETTLGELAAFSNGRTSPGRFDSGKYAVFGSNGRIGFSDETNSDANTIIIGRVGSYCGSLYFAKNKCWVTDNAIRANAKETSDPFYLYYLLVTLNLNLRAVGSGQPLINQEILNSIDVLLPPPTERKAIATILSSFDDKIELLRRQNKTLEAMAETLFRQWFVEEAQENWEEKPLSEVTKIAIGRTPPRKEFHWFSTNSTDVKWVSIKDLGESGVFVFETSEYLTKEAVETFNIPIIPNDTVLLSFKMTVGRVGITTEPMLSNEAIAHFIFYENTPFSKEYLYIFLNKFNYDSLGSTSSIVTAINSSMIKKMEIVIPDKITMKRFRIKTEPLFKKIKHNQIQIQILSRLLDVLLPKLMKGEIRLKDADILVKEKIK